MRVGYTLLYILLRTLDSSDAPIPFFPSQSDIDIFYSKIGQYLADTDTLPKRHYLHLTIYFHCYL